MRVIIAGSRRIADPNIVFEAVRLSNFHITEVISGDANGVDKLGEFWAKKQRPRVPVVKFPADWDTYGNKAGPLRNREMAAYGEALIAIPDDESVGTPDMIEVIRSMGKPYYVYRYEP